MEIRSHAADTLLKNVPITVPIIANLNWWVSHFWEANQNQTRYRLPSAEPIIGKHTPLPIGWTFPEEKSYKCNNKGSTIRHTIIEGMQDSFLSSPAISAPDMARNAPGLVRAATTLGKRWIIIRLWFTSLNNKMEIMLPHCFQRQYFSPHTIRKYNCK